MTADPNTSTTLFGTVDVGTDEGKQATDPPDPKGPKPPTPGPMMDNTNPANDPISILFNNSYILSTRGPMMENSKDFYSTLFDDPNRTRPPDPDGSRSPTPGPNGTLFDDPKGPQGQQEMGQPAIHSEMLQYKQSLGVISMILITTLMIFALLQIKVYKDCYANFKKGQLRKKTGKILFILFVIALIMSLINGVVFIHFIFNIDSISPSIYAYEEIFCMVPYRISKLAMSLFFILRLHFVFKDTAFKMNKYIFYTLIGLSIIGTILGCISGIVGPLHLIDWNGDNKDKGINPALLIGFISLGIAIFVDIVVMIYYNQRLRAVVVMQGQVSTRKSISRRKTFSTVATMTTAIELQTKYPQIGTSSSDDGVKRIISIPPTPTPTSTYEEDEEYEEFEIIETEVYVDKKLIITITKSTLLSLIGILTSFWLHIEMLIKAIYGESDGVLFRAIASFDGGVNVICMYLIFAFATPYYNGICILCHFVMSKCCTMATKRAVIREKSVTHTQI